MHKNSLMMQYHDHDDHESESETEADKLLVCSVACLVVI